MSAAELLLDVDRTSQVPLRVQLEQGLRELVRSGRVQAGATLPSSRTLAADLGVSRRLVVEAYEQLVAEGYLSASERSTTRLAGVWSAAAPVSDGERRAAAYDLRPGVPALAEFPRSAWLRAAGHVLRQAPSSDLQYPDPRGAAALRGSIAAYLRRVRAVAAEPQQVVICAGFRQALALLTRTLGSPVIGLEEPGLVGRSETVAAVGGSPLAVPVDGLGARTDLLRDSSADAMVVAPAHHFPLGVTLAPSRRSQLLSWASRAGRLVIEDDYDAEFRYDRQPVGALQGLAPGHVVYVGTASKTLAPALRLAWMVLPADLVGRVTEAKAAHDSGSPTLDQLTLAHLLDSGVYERHLRRMRRLYRQRRDALLAALHRRLPGVGVGGTAAGLHLVLTLPGGLDATSVVEAAHERDVSVTALDRYFLDPPGGTDRLVVGYGNVAASAVDAGVERLARAMVDQADRARTRPGG